MKKYFMLIAGCIILFACNNEKKDDKNSDEGNKTTMSTGDTKKPATELLDLSAADPVKNSMQAFTKNDIDGMAANYDDNIRYTWSGGDSAIGKQAVKDYYAGRWKLIDKISISNEIVLPVTVNESQQPGIVQTGKWVLYWGMVDVTYKNGKNIKFWIHNTNHFNDAGKVDFIGQYIDRVPLMEATKGMSMK